MLAVSCQMASFRGSRRNQMVTKIKPTILAQPNTCVGSQSAGSPTSASATGIMKSPAANSAIKYVTSKNSCEPERNNGGMLGLFMHRVTPEPCGSSSDLSSPEWEAQPAAHLSRGQQQSAGQPCL